MMLFCHKAEEVIGRLTSCEFLGRLTPYEFLGGQII